MNLTSECRVQPTKRKKKEWGLTTIFRQRGLGDPARVPDAAGLVPLLPAAALGLHRTGEELADQSVVGLVPGHGVRLFGVGTPHCSGGVSQSVSQSGFYL